MALRGKKHDAGKRDWTLLPWVGLDPVLQVVEYGAAKYGRENWRELPDAQRRYMAAAFRHLIAHARGVKNDPESGLPHLAHCAVNVLFLLETPEET